MAVPAANSTPTNTTQFTIPQPNWRSTISVGGAQNYSITEWTVSIKRMLQVYWTAQNAQTPYIIARGGLGVQIGVNQGVAADETALNWMLNGTPLAIQIQLDNGLTSTSHLQLTINATSAQAEKSKVTRNAVLIGYDDVFECVANSTDVGGSGGIGPATITLINNIPTY